MSQVVNMNDPAIILIGKDQCIACSACAVVCPNDALHMEENENGFLEPRLDAKKCVNCSICKKVCPVIAFNNNNTKDFICYAGWSLNKENVSHGKKRKRIGRNNKEFVSR